MLNVNERNTEQTETISLTPSVLRCIFAILELSKENRQVASRNIAEKLHIKPPSVCRLLESLQKDGLIQKEPYGKVELTAVGRQKAIQLHARVKKMQLVLAWQLGMNQEDSMQAAIYFVTTMDEEGQRSLIAHAAARMKGGDAMMPLSLAAVGEESMIRRVGGTPEVKKHLSDLGFVTGGAVTVVAQTGGNLIVNVKESRVAISREMAQKIMI